MSDQNTTVSSDAPENTGASASPSVPSGSFTQAETWFSDRSSPYWVGEHPQHKEAVEAVGRMLAGGASPSAAARC